MLNVHRGIASEYRGLDSEFWAIYHNDFNNIGVTIHKVDEHLDTGPYTFMEPLPLHQDMKIWQLEYFMTVLATELTSRSLRNYYNGNLVFHQQKQRGRYYSFFPTIFMKKFAARFHRYTKAL